MKTDLYTKIVLTVIAIALTGILLKDITFVSKAQAIPSPTEVFNTKTEGVIDVNIVEVNGVKVNNLPVNVKNENSNPVIVNYTSGFSKQDVPVKIGTSSNIPVEIKNGSYNAVPVEVKNTVTVKN